MEMFEKQYGHRNVKSASTSVGRGGKTRLSSGISVADVTSETIVVASGISLSSPDD
jgi:hypothetical protein